MVITSSLREFTKIYHKKNGIILPDETSNIYIVRVSNKDSLENYDIMKRSEKKLWDKDYKNKIKKGDWLGFIINKNNKLVIELYYIEDELSSLYRLKYWENNGREVIKFRNQSILSYNWDEWKKNINYSKIYIPRGTIRSKNPFGTFLNFYL